MDTIKIISEKIMIDWNTGKKEIRREDRDGNRYYKLLDGEIWTAIPSEDKPYKEGHGLCIEEAYCDMNRSFDIPNRLIKELYYD